MKETFDLGDLEKVAKSVYDQMRSEADEGGYPTPRWNRSQIVTQAVQSVAFQPTSVRTAP